MDNQEYRSLGWQFKKPTEQELKNKRRASKKKFRKKSKTITRFRKELIQQATPSEQQFLKLLKEAKKLITFSISFQKQWVTAREAYISDFYFKSHSVSIEIDGGYHNNTYRKRKDLEKEGFLLLKGIKTYRLTNEQADKIDTVEKMIEYLHSIGVKTREK